MEEEESINIINFNTSALKKAIYHTLIFYQKFEDFKMVIGMFGGHYEKGHAIIDNCLPLSSGTHDNVEVSPVGYGNIDKFSLELSNYRRFIVGSYVSMQQSHEFFCEINRRNQLSNQTFNPDYFIVVIYPENIKTKNIENLIQIYRLKSIANEDSSKNNWIKLQHNLIEKNEEEFFSEILNEYRDLLRDSNLLELNDERINDFLTNWIKSRIFEKEDPDTYLEYLKKGNELFEKGKYYDAIKFYYEVLQRKPKIDEIWFKLGKSNSIIGNTEEAYKNFNKALSINSNHEESKREIAKISEWKTEFQELVKRNELKAKSAMKWFKEANNFLNFQNLRQVVECFKEIIRIDPSIEIIYSWIGDLLVDLKNYSEALLYYDKALEINDYMLDVLFSKGNAITTYLLENKKTPLFNVKSEELIYKGKVLTQSEAFDIALECYNKIINTYPNSVKVWYNKGLLYEYVKNYDEANICAEKLSDIDPNQKLDYDLKFNKNSRELSLAENLYKGISEEKGLRKSYDQNQLSIIKNFILDAGCKYSRLHIDEIGEKCKIGNRQLIIDTVLKMIKDKEIYANYFQSSNFIAFEIQANLQNIKPQPKVNEPYTNNIEEGSGNPLEELFKKGKNLASQNRYTEATEIFNEILKVNENNAPVWSEKGKCQFNSQQYFDAIKSFCRVSNIKESESNLYDKAKVFKQIGLFHKAYIYYKEINRINPESRDALQELHKLEKTMK